MTNQIKKCNTELMRRLCTENNITFHDKAERKEYWVKANGPDSYYKICSWSAGEIFVGEYEVEEYRLIGFFHEFGHHYQAKMRLLPEFDDLPFMHFDEASAWRIGIRLARENGITFSNDAIRYAGESLSSYFQDNHREKTPLNFLNEALKYAFDEGVG